MTLTDYASKDKGPPEWIEEDQIASAEGYLGEDIVIEVKLASSENYDDLRFQLIRDGVPISPDRYRLSMRNNIVQLTLKQSQKNDAGYYSFVATRVGQENGKGALKKIHLSVSETSYEEGEPPVFLRRLSDLAVKVGTRTRFLVEIRSSTTLKIAWYKDDSPVHEGPRFSLVHEGNFHCVDVAPVTIEDQGCWTCMAENRSGRSSCTSTLTVIVPKAYKRPEFVEELCALLTEAGTVSLECKVVGIPTPVLRWFKDNKEIKAGDVFALTANPDDPTSLGVYTCEAINCMGTAYSSSKVHVIGRGSREGSLKPADTLTPSGPLPVFRQALQDECCRIGDTLALCCRVQVPPWPKAIAWYNKGGRIEPSEKYHIMEDGIGGYSVEVSAVEAVDEGEWKCVATSEENMKQFSSCYVAMSIPRNYRKPRFMENLKAVLTEEGLVSFECKVVGFPTPLLRWFKDGQELKPGDVYQLTGTNSLGSYCCIARNCMGEAKSTAELTIEDIQNQLNEEERFQLLSTNQPPKFIKGLRSCEARINEDFRFTVQVSVAPEPTLSWYRDDALMDESDKYRMAKESLGTCHLNVQKLEFIDQAEWKCVAANDYGHSVTSCFLKLIIPKHYKKPKFLESLRAILSEEGAVNLECKVIGVPQPVLKWYKDNVELKPGDIHRIISGQDGTCCLGTYTCEAINCMGTVSSSASLLGFEDKKDTKEIQSPNGHELARNLSLSTIHEERTSQLYDTPQTDHSVTLDERGEVSFSFDGKEVSVSLYETPDLTEEEALQIVEMYADQLSEHVTEHNVVELPPMRFVKETSTSGNLLMEAVVIDVSPDYFVSAEDDLRTEADFEDVSIMDDVTHVLSSPERDSRGSLKRSARYNADEDEKAPNRPPRKKSMSISSSKSEKSQRIESESFHSAQKEEPPPSPLSSLRQDDSDTFADALSSAHLSVTESLMQRHVAENNTADNRKRSLSTGQSSGSSLDNGEVGGDTSVDSVTGMPKKKQRKKKQRKDHSNSEEYSSPGYKGEKIEREGGGELEEKIDHTKPRSHDHVVPVKETETDVRNGTAQGTMKKSFTEEESLDDLESEKETAPAVLDFHTLPELQRSTENILQEPKMILREALKTYEKISDISTVQLFSIRERFNDMCQALENASRRDADNLEILMNLEAPLYALLTTIDEISAKEIEIVRDIFQPSIVQLAHAVETLGSSSLQSMFMILKEVNERISKPLDEREDLSSMESISDEFRNISEKIVGPLVNIQSAFTVILDHVEQSKLAMNGSTSPQQQVSTACGLATCLAELRECVSHTVHTAMTLRENETLNSLMEFREPLSDLQLVLASEKYALPELSVIKDTTLVIERLQNVVVTILENSGNPEAISRMGTILKSLKDTDRQISELMEQLSEAEVAQACVLKSLNIDESLSGVHFALSSVLEKQEKHVASCNLITCIEALRQTIGSSAVTIASLENPVDDEISREISKLNESLINLQADLLTEKHEPGEEQILNNLMSPIARLKEIVGSVIESGSSVELMAPMLELLEDIEKDAALVAKEISKKKSQEENVERKSRKKSTEGKLKEEGKGPKFVLAGQISRSLDPIKHWLSFTTEDSTEEKTESILSLTIDELKRNVSQIAIQTSYSEPPNDESLIEALIDLREPLIRLRNAISVYHGPEDLSALENLGHPMKHLLRIIMDVLRVHTEEGSLQSIIDIVEQIKNQVPFSIQDILHQQKIKQSAKIFNVETEEKEEDNTTSRETIPGTLTEIPSTPLEIGSAALSVEQATIEDNSKKTADSTTPDITREMIHDEQREREQNASKLIKTLSETLEKLQLKMTSILEDFEESTTPIITIPQSKLANCLEELRRTTSTIRMMTIVYGEETRSFEEKIDRATLVLTNLMQPLTSILELLTKSREHEISELMILNRLTPLLDTIENNLIKQTIDFIGKDGDVEKELESLLCVLQAIKSRIPIVVEDISSRRKVLECLCDISRPLENILERMRDLEDAAEDTLETDVVKILGQPTAVLLRDIKAATQELGMLGQRGPMIHQLRNLLEPLLEFHSCLSMVQSSRRSLVPEASLLDERRSVILRAVDGLGKQLCQTIEAIENMEDAALFKESLTLLNSAILQVQKQIDKTDYSRRSSSVKISLQQRLTGTLSRLASAIIAFEEHADRDTYAIVSKCLDALQKQIFFAQTQFIQIGNESINEEAIVEGFLYPTNQFLSALNVLKETAQRIPMTLSRGITVQLQELADSISELSSSLLTHRTELIQEASETVPIVETFSAIIDVLDHVKESIIDVEKLIEVEPKASLVITEVESVIDEIIELSQKEVENIILITEIPPSSAIVEEVTQPKIEDTSVTTQVSSVEDVETIARSEKMEHLKDIKKREKDGQGNERFDETDSMIQMSKFNSAINNLMQPLKEFINFMQSAMQVISPVSKSEEDKRKIQELTALVQILYDLQATNTSIKTTLSSLSIAVLDNQLSQMGDILVDLERSVASVISLTDEGIKPELKESIMTSLQSFAKPLNALEEILVSTVYTADKDKLVTENGESLSVVVKDLILYIGDTVKSLTAIQKYINKIAKEKETETSKVKEETKDIEETTAQPLEELIEAIMDSQEQIEHDKTSPIESSSSVVVSPEIKDIDDLKQTETESEKTFPKEADISMKQIETRADTAEIQQALTSSLPDNQMEELLIEEKSLVKSVAESLEEIEEQDLVTIDQAKIELIQSSEDTMQEERIKVETLRAIISPLEVLQTSFNEIGELGILTLSSEETVAFSSLLEPLLNLKFAISSEDTQELKQDVQKSSIAYVLEKLQKSIAIIEEQVQLDVAVEIDSNIMPKIELMRAIKKPLEELKMSIACIQSDSETCQLIQQQAAVLPTVKQIAVLQTFAKSVEEFGEKFIAITDQLKTEAKPIMSLQVAEKKEEMLAQEVLHKIIDPIHVLRETLAQIEDLNIHKAELLEISETKSEAVQLSTVIHPLEKLEQSLIANMQQIIVAEKEIAKEFSENKVSLINANLKPVLEELKNSIFVIQQQAISNENIAAAKTLNEALESLKTPLEAVETVIDRSNEITEMEKLSTLLTFAKSVEETANQLITIGKEDVTQSEIREASLLKTVTISIEGLQSAILKVEDEVSQASGTKESIKIIALECMVQPLQELQQSFLTAAHQETVLSLQRLPIKPTLDNLSKSVAVTQDQIMSVQEKLFVEADIDDVTVLKDFARSLGNLRTSTVVLQQLSAIENAGQQIVEIENASALQAFAKSIEEFKKCCSVIITRPKVVKAFATNAELKQPKVDAQLLENIIVPLRILQEQILVIEETKMQETEDLDVTDERKTTTVLSSLVGPLQQLEKSFVATVQKEHVIEHDGHNLTTPELLSVNLENLDLQPILEEVQKSIATVQEHVVLEAGSEIASEAETGALLKSIAQPLIDLRASVASIQQATVVAPESLNEFTQQQSVSALETFAETLHNLSECIAMCNHQQIIMEPAADTISEGSSSLNTWADIIEEPLSKVTRPMIVDQHAIESPTEIAVSISEDEASALKTLAKPLIELRECLAVMVEEHKIIAPSEAASSLIEKGNIPSLQTMIQPLLELRDAAAIVIQEQTTVERAKDHTFTVDDKNEFALRPLIEPLEELRHSIAIIQDQMLVETPAAHQQKDIILNTLAEPLLDLQRAISILETRTISPDIESMAEDTSNSWITECLAIPLHEIERSIIDIRQCTVTEPITVIADERTTALTPDWSIVETLITPMEDIKTTILRMENNFTEIETLKIMIEPLSNIQKNLTLLRNEFDLNGINEKDSISAVIESFSDLETCISLFEKKVVDKTFSEQSVTTNLSSPLIELKHAIESVKTSPDKHLKDLKRPLELMQNALETVLSVQRDKKLSELSTKLQNTISDINESIESIEHKLDQQQESIVVEVQIECEALRMLTKPLRNIKQCIEQIQKEPNTTDLMISALQNLEKSMAIIREQSADKPLTESQHTNFGITGLSKSLFLCLHELQESIDATKTLWHEKTMLEGLTSLEKPLCQLQAVMKIISDQFLVGETIWIIDKTKITSPKKSIKKEIKDSRIETAEKDDINEEMKTELAQKELAQDTRDLSIVDAKNTETEKKIENKEEKIKERKDKKSIQKKEEEQIVNKPGKEKEGKEKEEEKETKYEKAETHKKEKDQIQNENEKIEKLEIIEKTEEEPQKRKEMKQVKEKVKENIEQNKEDVKDEKIKQNEEHKKIKQTKETKIEEIKQIEEPLEKVDIINNVKNEIEEPKKIINDIKKEKDEQKNKESYESTEKEKTEEKREQEIDQIKEKAKDFKDVKEDKTKIAKIDKKEDEIESVKKGKEQKKEKEIDTAHPEVQEHAAIEKIKEKQNDKREIETEIIKKKEEQEILIDDDKKKEQDIIKDKESVVKQDLQNIQKKDEKVNQLKKEEEKQQIQTEEIKKKEKEQKETIAIEQKEEEVEKMENKKVDKLENKKDKSNKEKQLTAKIEKEEEKIFEDEKKLKKDQDNIQNIESTMPLSKDENIQKHEDNIDQLKQKEEVEQIKKKEDQKKAIVIEKDEKIKDKKIDELEKKEQESNQEKQLTEKINKEEQKKKNEIKKLGKEDEEQKETIQAEEIKIKDDEQVKVKKDLQKNKQKSTEKKDKKEEKTSEQQDEKIVQEKKIQEAQNEYVKKESDEDKSKRQSEKIKEDQEQEESTRIKQIQEEKIDKKIQEIQSREDLRSKTNDIKEEHTFDGKLRKPQEEKEYHFEEIEKSKKKEEQRQWKPHDDKDWSQDKIRKEERINETDKYRNNTQIDENHQKRNDKKFYESEIDNLQRKRIIDSSAVTKKEIDYDADERRREEKRIRRDETARLMWEEEQRLRRKHDEEIFRTKQRREEQIRENEWSRKRENESDRFLKNMLEIRSRSDKSMFSDIDYSREYTSRFDSGISTLSSGSRSYSSKDSLSSLSRRRLDDYWDYKLRGFSMDKYYFDTGPSYRRRRKRENRMIRARSTSLLKYEGYSTEDSDVTIVPSTYIRPTRRIKADTTSRINFYESAPCIYGQNEGLPWDKPKKPSFCTRLTNRVVETGMRLRLTCTVLGNPEPRVHWTKDGEKLETSISRCKTRYENGMAYLELHDAIPEDAGIYTCVAENAHGTSTTESTLKVYSDYKLTHMPPTFVRSITDIYRYADRKLILECRVRAHPIPSIYWLKDGQILQGERYKQRYLDDDVYRLEITDPNVTDNGQYTCRATNDLRTEEISHIIHIEDRDWQPASRNDRNLSDETVFDITRRPRFSNLLKDYCVPTGGTIALQVEVKGVPAPEVRWLRGDRKEPIAISKARTFADRGLHTLIVPEATESERGTYVCRAINAYGQVDMSAMIDVISPSAIDGGKPAVFISRPAKKSIDVTVGEDVSISFRVHGVPKPRVIWMKGLTDITDGPRSYKESIDDYVRLILKRVVASDEGTYCILVKNRYGCDRSFFSIKVKQRARSLTPSPDWNSVIETGEDHGDDMSYVRNVPGPISSEPIVIDGGKNWLSLSWGKAERRGPAPVIAYKVDAWLLGSDGGARWVELGITPINTFDAFNLRPGGEYKFRVTPRNRYGWGEPVTMTNSALVSESTDLPEFTKILPGQLKTLEGTPIELECEVHGDGKMEVRWYRETTEIDPRADSRFAIRQSGSKCSLTIANVKEDDSGRYVCEANNKIGKVSSFARVLVVTDPRIIEADAKLKNLNVELEDRPPQFTMRIRDRRVQTTYPVRLTCQVTGHPVPEITWYKNEVEISQDDHHIFWDDDSNFHTLEIIHSTLDDSGCYMATARNVNGSVSCRCTLVVDKGIRAYIAPEFLRSLDAAYTTPLDGELRMSAQLEAYPSVGVVWHRDGIRLRPSRRAVMTLSHDGTVQFSLANVTARDAGVYSCTAMNAVGRTETSTRVAVIAQDQFFPDKSVNITSACPDIPYSKEPLFVTKPLSTEAVEGDTVVILCEVVGDPKPEVIWLRDFLKPDYYRDAPHFRLVDAGPQYRLEIPYAKLDFTGTYSVIARNCHGEAKAIISLQIYAKGQGKEEQMQRSQSKVLTLPIVKRELRDIRCCDGDAVSLECKVYATPEPPLVRWERGGKIMAMVGDFAAEFDGETARLSIQHVYPEDEGEYTCVAYNDLGKAYTSACLVVDVPEGKENILSQRLTRPVGLLSAGSTPRSTPRSTPIRSLSPTVSHGREFRSPQVLPRSGPSRRPKFCPPKFYAVPHNRLVQEGETVRFQCAVIGHPAPWIRWDKNNTIVTPSARISIKERDDVKILEIVDVMREDAGLYRVTAENDFGRIEASARLEVISRHESTSRTIRTRSASPRTYPSFDRSLLPTTSRINSHLQLECRVRGMPSVTPTWYRNGRPLERSTRIKRYFDGITAKIEVSKVKASDAGEYTCIATNVLGSTRSNCQVTVLDPHDSIIADKTAPRFLQSLPEESIVMENHSHELQTGVIGTPPFTITWSKDGRELPDDDNYKYIVYGDGGIALRLSEVWPPDAGEYTCVVQNDFGIASCSGLLAVQDYKDVVKLAPQFTKTPLSVIAAKGTTAYFCVRVQYGRTMEIIWMINGKDARENAKCKIERDGNVSILRINDVSARDTGEIRCIARVNGEGPSISCVAMLRLQRPPCDLDEFATKLEDLKYPASLIPSPMSTKLTAMMEKIAAPSLLKHRRECENSSTRARSSSFPRSTASCIKHISPLPTRKRIFNNTLINTRKSRFENDPLTRRITKKNLDDNAKLAKTGRSSLHEEDAINSSVPPSSAKTERLSRRDTGVVSDEKYAELYLEEELTKATIVKEPTDVTVFKGNKTVLRIVYRGCPEPMVKWFRVNREIQPDEKIGIANGNGVSCLTLDDVTYDHAGKYEVSVENSLGKERRFFSLAVEGPPEPLADKPSVSLSNGRATIIWRSPPYDGGRTVIGYTVEAKRAGESTWIVIAERCHSLSHTIATIQTNSVTPGESYCFRVRAENIHGLSDSGMESDPVRIPKEGETMVHDEEEDEFEPSFEARMVDPEEGQLFGEKYDVLEELGKGRYGIVKKVIERATGIALAAKFVRTIKAKDREQVREEIRIMNILRHPKLLLLAAAYENPRETVLVTEYISGGELFERVVADDFTLTERDSILFMRQICQGVEYMHKNNIVHLDLKPENIMCRTRTSHQIKLIDFGLAQTLRSDMPVRVLFGTPEFIPPEIISYEPIGTQSDMWSVGVICYVLLTGLSPFMGDNDAETFANITRADYDLEDEAFDAISNDAKDFISGLLIKRKELRMSATQCLEHPWMAQQATAMSRIALPTEKLKKFIIRRKWQKTGNAIRALGRMAILSAYSRRSVTTTAELSREQMDNLETNYSEERTNSNYVIVDDEDSRRVEKNTEEDSTETKCRTGSCVMEINMQIQEIPTEESSLCKSVERISTKKEEIPKLDIGLISEKDAPQNAAVHFEILLSRNNDENNKKLIEKPLEVEQCETSKSQTPRKVFRGDSRDSGIGDCSSTIHVTSSSLQIDELGLVSTIEEEVDHETYNRENERILKTQDTLKDRRSSTMGILENLIQNEKILPHETANTTCAGKVATKNDVTKTACETNPMRKATNENTDARILSNRDKFLPIGNVSRTAKIFERESGTSKSESSQLPAAQRAYPATIVPGKMHNERIQKAFAFWNK